MSNDYLIKDREPQALYHFFEDISRIPRITFHEKEISQYLVEFAESRGLWCYRDQMYNVLIKKKGSAGCENLPPVLLEGHVDMVAAKAGDSDHNFETDPIELIVEGNILRANKTTLGADNGCAVAMMLTLLDKEDLVHPPLECLFTVQEETGLDGAKAFDMSKIDSRRMIGLDAGSEGVFRMGTTTKIQMTAALKTEREETKGKTYELLVDGLRGGDQGANVPKERISAIKMTFRALHYLNQDMDVRVISTEKLGKGIPEDCRTRICLADGEEARMNEILERQQQCIRREYAESDPDIRIRAVPVQDGQKMMTKECSDNLINSIYLMPYGARNRKPCKLDEVRCSVIMKKIYTDPDAVRIFSVISTEEMIHGDVLDEEMRTFVRTLGWEVESVELDKGWDWEAKSPIRDTMVKSYVELYGKEPVVNISHGGNDCVVFKHKIPEMDMVTTAATYEDYHTPNEHLYLDSFERVYYLLERVLFNLSEEHAEPDSVREMCRECTGLV